jgi:PAS domain S-box-containing protein
LNYAGLISPVIQDAGKNFILQLSREGKVIYQSGNWETPTEGFTYHQMITFPNTAELNLTLSPSVEYIKTEIANAANTLWTSLLFSLIALISIYFSQKFRILSTLNELRFRKTLESMVEGCQIINPDWRTVFINDAAARQYQVSREDLVGRTMMDCFPKIEKSSKFALMRRCMEKRTNQEILDHVRLADGSEKWYELSVQPSPDGILILSYDVTERERAAAILKESEKKFRQLFENSPLGQSMTEINGSVSVNNTLSEMLGYTRLNFPIKNGRRSHLKRISRILREICKLY